MSYWRLVVQSLIHHWRSSAAIAAGVMVGTAVLTGALLVGDSVRGSLRQLVVDRLGRIDQALVVDRFFRADLASELQQAHDFPAEFTAAVPAIVMQATVEVPASGRRANQVHLIGAEPALWQFHSGESLPALQPDQIALNQPLADELGVRPGDSVIVRMPTATEIPADSPLGRKTETVRNRRLTVAAIMPARGLGQFSLRPTQQATLNAFVLPAAIQQPLDQPGRVNAILVATSDPARAASLQAGLQLQQALRPRLSDYGLSIRRVPRGYFNLTSQRMLLDPAVVEAAGRAFPQGQVALTYLANSIALGERAIPYSTVAALDPASEPPLGPFETLDGRPLASIGDDEIVLNAWAAEDLGARTGDTIKLVYFRPDSTHGKTEETSAEFKLVAIVKLSGAAADPDFTPEVKGITDEKSIADWDPPFPFDARRIRSHDETYWDEHRGTPKAFVSLRTGQRLWGSRFGDVTTIRIPPSSGAESAEAMATALQIDPPDLGFSFLPVKRQGLQAAVGTTPFQWLFIGFSMFLIAAALMLVALLFRLAIETRASEVGLLAALGLSARQVRRLWLIEGLLLATAGGIVGVVLGITYAWLMSLGLNTWWVAAVTTPFVQLHVTPMSLLMGLVSGALVSWLMIALSLRRLRRVEIRQLLHGELTSPADHLARCARWPRRIAVGCLSLALLIAALGARLSAEAQAGAFMGCGALVLTGLLVLLWDQLRSANGLRLVAPATLARMAVRNSARQRGRTMLAVGLVASAVFLIVSISAFRLEPPALPTDRDTGTGGFPLIAESDQPIYENVSDALALQNQLPAGAAVFAARVRAGDDASCLNLYQSQQPRVLGVPESFLSRGGFAWSASLAKSPDELHNPWRLLDQDFGRTSDGRVILPVVLDAATALYSLHLRGVGSIYELPLHAGATHPRDRVPCLVVGLLKNSILQGSLVASERRFLEQFPAATGYRFFFIDVPVDRVPALESALEKTFGDYGFDAQSTRDRLAGYLVVQNTYLSTFQSLGGLGLLLGTLGLAVVELRNVLERRAEMALLRAVGFRRRWLGALVMYENLALLLFGLAIGLGAALVAVAPHLFTHEAAIPWGSLAAMLILIAVVGFVAGLAAVRATLRAPLVAALRGE